MLVSLRDSGARCSLPSLDSQWAGSLLAFISLGLAPSELLGSIFSLCVDINTFPSQSPSSSTFTELASERGASWLLDLEQASMITTAHRRIDRPNRHAIPPRIALKRPPRTARAAVRIGLARAPKPRLHRGLVSNTINHFETPLSYTLESVRVRGTNNLFESMLGVRVRRGRYGSRSALNGTLVPWSVRGEELAFLAYCLSKRCEWRAVRLQPLGSADLRGGGSELS